MTGDDASRRRRALELLEEALERPTSERRELIERRAARDDGLRDEVLRLLELAEDEDDLAPLVERAAPTEPERTVGPYRLKARVGAGGMGEVWRAERADGAFHREVAVKLLRADVGGDDLAARFARERQVQAALAHPGIAQLLDGGEDADGVPYLVLEYVDGRPIDEHCRARGLDDRARLRLFLDVCAAVAHAHGRGVVHRDLKPSNILVGEDGRPRLLDFGIARVLDPAMIAPGLDVTQGTFRMMTPAYASPEQLRLEPATPASDQYALGVLLFELLTGRLPFDLEGRSPAEIERMVTDEEPARPSTTRLDPRLPGDLDWIVLRALRKEPQRRYASVEDLARDVRRFLAGEPVRARPDSAAYRASKFVRRYPVPVTLAALLFVALSAGIVVSLHQLGRANEAAHAASLAETEAEAEREEAEEVTKFLTGMIDDAAPGGSVDRAATIRDALDAAARILERRDWTGRAPLEARLRGVVGRVYVQLGAFAAARPHVARAVELVRADPSDRELWSAVMQVYASLLKAEEQLHEAEVVVRELLVHREDEGDEAPRLAAVNDLAGILRSQGRLDDARPLFEEAVEGLEGRDRPVELAQALNNLGVLEHQSGRQAAAVPLLERAIELADRHRPIRHPEPLLFRSNLGLALGELGRLDESIPLLRAVHDAQCVLLGIDHAETCATRRTLTLQLARSGRVQEAARLAEWNVRLTREAHGGRHLLTAEALETAGKLRFNVLRDLDGAWLRTAAALEVRRALLPRHDRRVIDLRLGLGLLKRRAGDHSAAVDLLQSALAAPDETLVESGLLEPITVLLVRSCVDAGRFADAAWAYERRTEWLEERHGEDDPRTIDAVAQTGFALAKVGHDDAARERLATAYERLSTLAAPPPDELRRVLSTLAVLDDRRDRADEAAEWRARLDALGAEVRESGGAPDSTDATDGTNEEARR